MRATGRRSLTDTGIYLQRPSVPMCVLHPRVRFITGRVSAVPYPGDSGLLALDANLLPVVDRVVPWETQRRPWPTMAGKTVVYPV